MRKTGKIINCAVCGKEKYYAAWILRRGGTYCSKACNLISLKGNKRWNHPNAKKNWFIKGHISLRTINLIKICLTCKKQFKTTPTGAHKYCSINCYFPNRKKQINCNFCGKSFHQRRRDQKYCSRPCRNKTYLGRRPHNYKRVEKACLYCNKIFDALPHLIRRGYGKFCSHKCFSSYREKHWVSPKKGKPNLKIRGKSHPQWKGGRKALSHRIRGLIEYKAWRGKVFQRDNWTCQICNIKNHNNINADHYPVSFSEILDKFNINTLEKALACETLWNINIGRTLCIPCHKTTSNYFKARPILKKVGEPNLKISGLSISPILE